MSNFKVGDRVKKQNETITHPGIKNGELGTVSRIFENDIKIEWDNGKSFRYPLDTEYLKKMENKMETFTVELDKSHSPTKFLIEIAQDEGLKKFKYTDPNNTQGWAYLLFYHPRLVDCDFCYTQSKSDNHLKDFTFSEFKAALRGEYEFTKSQPFDSFGGHEVVFKEDAIEIGCILISKEKIKKLYNAVKDVEQISGFIAIKHGSDNIHKLIKQTYKYYYE